MLYKDEWARLRTMNRNIFFFAIKLLVSAALISFLVSKLDVSQIILRLEGLKWFNIVLAAGIFIVLALNNALRWSVVLSSIGKPYPFGLILRLQLIGAFFNQTLPSAIGGDAVRIYLVHKSGAPLQTSVNGILLERVVTLAGLIFLVTLVQPFLDLSDDANAAKYIFPALSVLAILGMAFLTLLDRSPRMFSDWKIFKGLGYLAHDAKLLFLAPSRAAQTIGLGITGNILICLFAYESARALGIGLSLDQAMVLIPPAILVSALPISIAGWGVREGTMVSTLSLVGIPEIDAFTLSVLFGMLMALFSMPGGIVWLLHRSKSE